MELLVAQSVATVKPLEFLFGSAGIMNFHWNNQLTDSLEVIPLDKAVITMWLNAGFGIDVSFIAFRVIMVGFHQNHASEACCFSFVPSTSFCTAVKHTQTSSSK